MSIVTTHKCQLNCPFCVDMHGKTNEEISIDNVILLVGGEPTLHSKIVQIAECVKSNGFKCILTTNYQRPDVILRLDGVVDCFNISYYQSKNGSNLILRYRY